MNTEVIVFRTKVEAEGWGDDADGVLQRKLSFVFEGKKDEFPEEKKCFEYSEGMESEFFNRLEKGELCLVNAEDGCAIIKAFEDFESDWFDDTQKQLGIEETVDFLKECAKHDCELGVSILLSASQKEMGCIWARSNAFLDVELAKIVFTPENTKSHPALLSDCRAKLPEKLCRDVLLSTDKGAAQERTITTTTTETEETRGKRSCKNSQPIKRFHDESASWTEMISPFSVRMCFNEEEMTPESHYLFGQNIGLSLEEQALNGLSGDEIRNKYESTLMDWQVKAEKGNRAAMTNLGACYASGRGVTADSRKAFEWWQKAAELGDVSGTFNLAMSYFNGIGVDENKAKAVELLERASAMGNNFAAPIIGMCYERGDGVPQNYEMAAKYYRNTQGSKVSQSLLQRLQDQHLV